MIEESQAYQDNDLAVQAAGGAAGAVADLLIDGGVGTVLGAATSPLLVAGFRFVVAEIKNWALSPRERLRAETTLSCAARRVRSRLDAGAVPRTDGFLQGDGESRAAVTEILEGALRAAQTEHQEAKVQHYGYLLANLAFAPGIGRARANSMLRLAQSLTYRQLVVLAVLSDPKPFALRDKWYERDDDVPDEIEALLNEIFECYHRGLVVSEKSAILHPGQIWPAALRNTKAGQLLADLMELPSISHLEREEVARLLATPTEPPRN